MKQFMPNVSEQERKRLLEENAAKVEHTTYQRPLLQEELVARRESLADNCIMLNQLEDELKEIKDGFKIRMDPIKSRNKTLLVEIKTKQETIEGPLYYLPSYEESLMDIYNQEGQLINSRRLLPAEKQGNIFSILKTQNL